MFFNDVSCNNFVSFSFKEHNNSSICSNETFVNFNKIESLNSSDNNGNVVISMLLVKLINSSSILLPYSVNSL